MKIITTKKSPNYSRHPGGKAKEYVKTAVMMHSTIGSFRGAVDWLSTTPEERLKRHGKKTWSSAHNVDDRNDPGVIHQLMPLQYRAWHAGGVTRRTQRAMDVIGVRDPNNVCIGHEFVNYFDVDRDGSVEDDERKLTQSQINDFVDYMFWLEEESITNDWLDIRADRDHLLTHHDTNHHKPNMDDDLERVVVAMDKKRAELSGLNYSCNIDDFSLSEIINALIRKLKQK